MPVDPRLAERFLRVRTRLPGVPELPTRSFGPGRSPRMPTSRPAVLEAARMSFTTWAWRDTSACEKFRRNTSTTASIISTRVLGSQLAGPTVATIFVFLTAELCSTGLF